MLHAIIVDGNWANWSNWSMCDVTCGNGTQVRTRSCTHPAPEYGGTNCTGPHLQNQQCVREVCPGTYKTTIDINV
jgi:syndecan 4/thrombospondin 1